MSQYTIHLTCLGQRYAYTALAPSACDAVLAALTAFPQACRISARPARASKGGAA